MVKSTNSTSDSEQSDSNIISLDSSEEFYSGSDSQDTSSEVEAAPTIHLNQDKLCQTTGWYNNCGLNCLTHFLLFKLETGELETTFDNTLEYNKLLETFKEYYHLPETPTWRQLFTLFEEYPVPTDREAIFAPVLREYVGKILLEDKANQWLFASDAFSGYLKTGAATDVAGDIYHANQDWFKERRTEYRKQLAQLKKCKLTLPERIEASNIIKESNSIRTPETVVRRTRASVADKAKEIRKTKLMNSFLEQAEITWNEEGAARYASYVGDLYNNVMITADQLQIVSQRLGISAEIYTSDSIKGAKKNPQQAALTHGAQNIPDDNIWRMRVWNEGYHWQLEHPSVQEPSDDPTEHEQTTQNWINFHNQHYPNHFNKSFLADEALSGKLKLYAEQERQKEFFINTIREHFELPPMLACYAKKRSETQIAAHEAMGSLLKKLHDYVKDESITREQRQTIFEMNFDAFRAQLDKKQNKKQAKQAISAIKKLAQTVNHASLDDLQNGEYLLVAGKKRQRSDELAIVPFRKKPKKK